MVDELTDEELAEWEYALAMQHTAILPSLLRYRVIRLIAALRASRAENKELKEALDQAQLRSIEARNPGIDMEEVKRIRRGG